MYCAMCMSTENKKERKRGAAIDTAMLWGWEGNRGLTETNDRLLTSPAGLVNRSSVPAPTVLDGLRKYLNIIIVYSICSARCSY